MTERDTLLSHGFRFVLQDREFKWVHLNEIKPAATDCTDMPDDDFEYLVRQNEAQKRSDCTCKWDAALCVVHN